MLSTTLRGVWITGGMALVLLGAPAESKAIFDWLCPSNWCKRPVTYAPAASIANPCATACMPASTCYYVPQTSYRTRWACSPVTACRPVSACDPCTGCATTTYRPFTSFAMRPVLVPYTTYRIVYGRAYSPVSCGPCAPSCAVPSCAAPACGPCGSYTPAPADGAVISGAPVGGSGCSSCTAPGASVMGPGVPMPAPSLSTPPASIATPAPSGAPASTFVPTPGPATPSPSPSNTPLQPAPNTPQGGSGLLLNPPGGMSGSPLPSTRSTGSYGGRSNVFMPNTYTGPAVRSVTPAGPGSTLQQRPLVRPIPMPGTAPAAAQPQAPAQRESTPIRQAVYVAPASGNAQTAVDEYDWHASRD